MVELIKHGVYLLDGQKVVEDTTGMPSADEARENTITYGILRAHDVNGGKGKEMHIRFDAMMSHDITYVGIIQTARASGLTKFPLPYAMTNCHNSLCAVGGTINEDDHVFGLSAAKKYGGIYVPANQAVIHQFAREEMVKCGNMILGSDSHTRYGSLGNMGVGEGGGEGGQKGEELVERQTAKAIRSGIRHHKMKPYKAVEKAERQLMSANAEYFYQKSLRDNPQIAQAASNPISRMWQKRRIKQQYAKAARQAGQAAAQGAAATAENGFRVTKLAAEGGERVAEFAARNWKTILIVAVFGLLALLLITGLQSCTVMAGTAGTGVTASSYFSKDKDMLGAEKAYAKLEQKLQRYLDTYEATHNYDEYHFYLDEIEHDPYVLISILSALHDGVFTLAEVQGELEMLFEKQYILTETVTMQIRYRTKMMVIIGPYGVPQVITYQEPYEYYICTVKLKNKDLSHLPVEVLTEEQLSAYSLYMRTLGNRPDLFGQAQYPNASTIKQPTYYDIPPEALKDDRFAAMMEEATKYIGYPYVWGGSSPSTSFDCSGYISWVLNHSGWNVGRQTAQGLYNLCTPVSTAQVKPGDLVFFKGTYDTPGVSHCGIYVGNSIMLHCGDPISYTNLNSKYWQEHFYSYGRLP